MKLPLANRSVRPMPNDPQTGMNSYPLLSMNRLSTLLPALLLTGLLFSGCTGTDTPGTDTPGAGETPSVPVAEETPGDADGAAPAARTVRVSTTILAPTSFEEIIPITGSVSAPQDASLSAQSAGTLIRLAEVGTRVAEGEVVARLDDRLIRAALDGARANFESASSQAQLAEETWRRQEPLYRDSIISALEFETVTTQRNQARAALAQANAAVAQAEQQLENTYLRAPFSGTVEERFTNTGEQVMPGMPVARIVNTRNLKVVAGVPEVYAADIQVGTPVHLAFRAYGDASKQATVSFVGNVINPQNRTFSIEIKVDNDSGILKPAMIADLKLTRRVLADRIVIPQTSILRDENGSSVYLAVSSTNGKIAERRAIELGPSFAGETVVMDGLSAGDELIVAGQMSVTEGDRIDVATR